MSKNDDALRCAEKLEQQQIRGIYWVYDKQAHKGAAHIRRLVAENEAQAALLRQAVEAMEHTEAWWNSDEVVPSHVNDCRVTIAAIRQHLEGKA